MKFFQIQHPVGVYFSGRVLSYVVIAIIAVIFGAIVGGIVGSVSLLIIHIVYGFSQWSVLFILLQGLYGFIIGKTFKNKTIKANDKNAIGGIGLFSLLSLDLYIVIRFFNLIISGLISDKNSILDYFRWNIISILINSLVIGVICFVLLLIYHKCLNLINE